MAQPPTAQAALAVGLKRGQPPYCLALPEVSADLTPK